MGAGVRRRNAACATTRIARESRRLTLSSSLKRSFLIILIDLFARPISTIILQSAHTRRQSE